MEPIIVTSRAALSEVVAAALESALKHTLPPLLRQATTKPYLTKKELMELTGWSSRQVEYKKANQEIAYIRTGRTVLFPTDAVAAFLQEGYMPSRQCTREAVPVDRPGHARRTRRAGTSVSRQR